VSRHSGAKFTWDRYGQLRPHDRLRFARTDMRLGTVAGPIGPREASGLSVELSHRSVVRAWPFCKERDTRNRSAYVILPRHFYSYQFRSSCNLPILDSCLFYLKLNISINHHIYVSFIIIIHSVPFVPKPFNPISFIRLFPDIT
jgi:hypothetical protein